MTHRVLKRISFPFGQNIKSCPKTHVDWTTKLQFLIVPGAYADKTIIISVVDDVLDWWQFLGTV